MFEKIEIRSIDPKSIYVYPNKYTFEGIKKMLVFFTDLLMTKLVVLFFVLAMI